MREGEGEPGRRCEHNINKTVSGKHSDYSSSGLSFAIQSQYLSVSKRNGYQYVSGALAPELSKQRNGAQLSGALMRAAESRTRRPQCRQPLSHRRTVICYRASKIILWLIFCSRCIKEFHSVLCAFRPFHRPLLACCAHSVRIALAARAVLQALPHIVRDAKSTFYFTFTIFRFHDKPSQRSNIEMDCQR